MAIQYRDRKGAASIPILRAGKPYESVEKIPILHHATGAPVAMISHRFWGQGFGLDPAVVGRVITVNDRPVTIEFHRK